MSRIFTEKYLIWAIVAIMIFPVIKNILPVTVPFLMGFGLALLAEPIVSRLSNKFALRRSIAVALGILCVMIASFTLLTSLLSLLLRQLTHIAKWLPNIADTITQGTLLLQQWLLSLADKVPKRMQPALRHTITSLFQNDSGILQHMMERLPQIAGNALGRLSNGFIGAVTAILSAFMISAKLPHLRQWIRDSVPPQVSSAITGFRRTLGHWILAQGKLAGIAFLLLWLGFMILKIPHHFLWAALITCVDILPILGVGTVLIPWSLISYLQGNPAKALGLLGIFGAIWLIRSVLEPKLIGKELGLDPLVTLLCIYAGFRLWGIIGMLLTPIAAVCVVQLCRSAKHFQKPASPP